jgi:hypothetical protein
MKGRLREAGVVTASPKRKRWTDLKSRLETFDRAGLVGLIADLLTITLAPALDPIVDPEKTDP